MKMPYKNKEKRKNYQKEYRKKHIKKISKYNKNWNNENKYDVYKRNCNETGKIFSIPREEFDCLVHLPCYYCGDMTDINGIDRVDNNKGYISGNCVPCCKTCNFMKGKLSYDKFIEKIKQIVKNKPKGI